MAKIKKGDKLTIRCARKGTYDAVAMADFDTENDEWYEVALDQEEPVHGMATGWYRGDRIPCRRGVARVLIRAGNE